MLPFVSPKIVFAHTTARAYVAARMMMPRAAGHASYAFLAAASISTFSLFTGMPPIPRRGAECACRCGLGDYRILTPYATSDRMNFIKCSVCNTAGLTPTRQREAD